MGNETINPGQWQQNNTPLGTGEGESPIINTAQGPRIEARTMESDISSIQTGETTPKTYVPQQAQTAPSASAGGGGVADINPQSFELPKVDTINQQPQAVPVKKKNGLFVGIVIFIVLVGLAALGYFVVYPIFFGESQQTSPVANITPETETPPVTPPQNETAATSTTAPETSQTTPEQEKPSHISAFKIPADASMEVTSVITGGSLGNITLSTAKNPSIVEVTIKDGVGNLSSFGAIMQAIFGGDFSSGALLNAFPNTGVSQFIYVDAENNRAIGIIAKADQSASLADVKAAFAQTFEANKNYSGLFTTDPGIPGLWKNGQTSGIQNRYLTFSNPGFSINYGWSGNTLIISGSYEGFKAAVAHIQ